MARLARVVVSGVAHDVTQRGNRRQPTFFQEDDYQAYLDRIEERLGRVVRPAKRGPKPKHEGN
jgi:putative transposase